MKVARVLLGFAVIVAGSVVTSVAQEIAAPPTQLALEVHFFPNEPPAFQTVHAASRAGAWYGRFGHVSGWKQPADSPVVSAVNIKSELAEDGVRIWVSVYIGELHEHEKNIAAYVLREGEKTTVRELAHFGVEPFEIKVVRVNPTVAETPQFFSKAQSIEVVVMQSNVSTLPSCEVVVRNVSSKNVNALEVRTTQAGRTRISYMPQGREGNALILPGGTYQFTMESATKSAPSADGYAPVVLPNQVIEISTAVFDDGSFEGDNEPALTFSGLQKGRKHQLERVIHLFETTSAAAASGSANPADLRAEVEALSLEANSAAVQELHNKFPGVEERRIKNAIENGMKGIRDQVLNDVVQFQLRNRRLDGSAFRDWLRASAERYQAWARRL